MLKVLISTTVLPSPPPFCYILSHPSQSCFSRMLCNNLLHLPLWCVHCFIMLALSLASSENVCVTMTFRVLSLLLLVMFSSMPTCFFYSYYVFLIFRRCPYALTKFVGLCHGCMWIWHTCVYLYFQAFKLVCFLEFQEIGVLNESRSATILSWSSSLPKSPACRIL